jgi:hypothetical protein
MKTMSHKLDESTAWKYLVEIGQAERHFNVIESTYRGLASTWLLASFAGMGFAVNSTSLPVPRGIVIFAISVAGSLGVQLLWVVDLLAYHHLLAAYFLEGLRIEDHDRTLPQVRWKMWEQGIVERRVKMFYAGCSLVLLPFGLVAVFTSQNLGYGRAFAVLLSAAVPVILVGILWSRSWNAWLYEAVKQIRPGK